RKKNLSIAAGLFSKSAGSPDRGSSIRGLGFARGRLPNLGGQATMFTDLVGFFLRRENNPRRGYPTCFDGSTQHTLPRFSYFLPQPQRRAAGA
ncbi:MAG: hypothetical protein N2C14_17085, partial [Planctomycetales bacterium]